MPPQTHFVQRWLYFGLSIDILMAATFCMSTGVMVAETDSATDLKKKKKKKRKESPILVSSYFFFCSEKCSLYANAQSLVIKGLAKQNTEKVGLFLFICGHICIGTMLFSFQSSFQHKDYIGCPDKSVPEICSAYSWDYQLTRYNPQHLSNLFGISPFT